MQRKEIEGKLTGKGIRIGIVVSRFNSHISHHLLEGALDCLRRHGVNDVTIYWTPGSFEIPFVVKKVMNRHDGILALGAVIRGDTPHFEYIASEVTRGLGKLVLEGNTPIAFGIITADTEEQALSRAGMKAGNKGWDAALSLLELVNLSREIDGK